MSYVRKMAHAGDWYPTDDKIKQMMKASFYYAQTEEKDKENLVGIISPHSCYSVCLKIAAKSYARIDPTRYQRLFILGTCHHLALGSCLVSEASEVETPFGNIPVDVDMCRKLTSENPELFKYMTQEVDEAEHSLEMQYPIIKYWYEDNPVSVVPILVGSITEETEEAIVPILSQVILSEGTLFVISSDFTHWGEIFKFTGFANMHKPLSAQVQLFDDKAMNIISGFNYDHFRFHIEEISGSICGCYSICLMLHILNSGYKAELIDRHELCQILSPSDFSISYCAVSFYRKEYNPEEEEEERTEFLGFE